MVSRPKTNLTEPVMQFLHGHEALPQGLADNTLVLDRGGGKVLRIGFGKDDGWLAYARWATYQVPGYYTRPTVFHLNDQLAHHGYYTALVERLYPADLPGDIRQAMKVHKRDPLALAKALQTIEDPMPRAWLRQLVIAFPEAHWDLGPTNWMQRADGTLVLNDPMSYAAPKR